VECYKRKKSTDRGNSADSQRLTKKANDRVPNTGRGGNGNELHPKERCRCKQTGKKRKREHHQGKKSGSGAKKYHNVVSDQAKKTVGRQKFKPVASEKKKEENPGEVVMTLKSLNGKTTH